MSTKSKQAVAKDKHCTKFEPQTWRKHVCIKCFRTREQHEQMEKQQRAAAADASAANGSVVKSRDASSSAVKDTSKSKQTDDKSGSGSKSPSAAESTSKSKSSGEKSDLSKKGPGLLKRTGSKDNGNGSPVRGKSPKVSAGNSKKQTTSDRERPSSAKRGASSPGSPLSPPTGKKSPLSSPAGKKSPLSPPVRKRSPLSPPPGKKSPLSPPTTKKPRGKSSGANGSTTSKSVTEGSQRSGASESSQPAGVDGNKQGQTDQNNLSKAAASFSGETPPGEDDPGVVSPPGLGGDGTATTSSPTTNTTTTTEDAPSGSVDETTLKISPGGESEVSADISVGLSLVGGADPVPPESTDKHLPSTPSHPGAIDAAPPAADDPCTTTAATIILELPTRSDIEAAAASDSSGSTVCEPRTTAQSAPALTPPSGEASPSGSAGPAPSSSPSEPAGPSQPVSCSRGGQSPPCPTGRDGGAGGETTEGNESRQGEEGGQQQEEEQERQVDTQGRATTPTDTTTTATATISFTQPSSDFDVGATNSDDTTAGPAHPATEASSTSEENVQLDAQLTTPLGDHFESIIILEEPVPQQDEQDLDIEGSSNSDEQQSSSGLIHISVPSEPLRLASASPDEWFEAETDLSPPAAFSDPKTPTSDFPPPEAETATEVTLHLESHLTASVETSAKEEEQGQTVHAEKESESGGVTQDVFVNAQGGTNVTTPEPKSDSPGESSVQSSTATLKFKQPQEEQKDRSDDHSPDRSVDVSVTIDTSDVVSEEQTDISSSPLAFELDSSVGGAPLKTTPPAPPPPPAPAPSSSDVTADGGGPVQPPRERDAETVVYVSSSSVDAPGRHPGPPESPSPPTAAKAAPAAAAGSASVAAAEASDVVVAAVAAAAAVPLIAGTEPLSPSSPELVDEGPVIESGPVFASTFKGVSKPSSPDIVAAATLISPHQPNAATFQSTPPPRKEPETVPGTDSFVNKVDSFVVRQPPSPTPTEPSPAQVGTSSTLNFQHYTIEPSATFIKSDTSSDDLITEGYGGYASTGQGQGQGQDQQGVRRSRHLHEEDITTLASVTVDNVSGRQLAPVKRSNSLDSGERDSSVFYIARHKPQDNFHNFERTVQFSGTGRRRRRMSDAFVREDAMMEGTRMLIDNLREKHMLLEEKNCRLEREKTAVTELLTVKKNECIKIEEESKKRIVELDSTCSRLESENARLNDRLKLPESERIHIRDQEVELEQLKRKLNEAEDVIGQLTDESASLQHEIKDMHLEMEEMHDQFRDDEALEFRDLQKELEATAKNCRILQFKLRKAERRNDALESGRVQYEEKIRHLESRFKNSNDQNQIRELEEELRMAKEVSVRLHDELEVVEERRMKFEEELDRTHDLLRESERGRSVLQKELDCRTEELEQLREGISEQKDVLGDKLDVPTPKKPTLGKTGSREGSVDYDIEQLMRDLSDSLEREHDLKGQLKYAEEETINLRNKLSESEDENEIINLQLQKMSSAKSGKYFQKRGIEEKDIVTEKEHELRIQMELAEEEINVLRRKMNEIERDNETLSNEVRNLQRRLNSADEKRSSQERSDPASAAAKRPHEERISAMAKDIDDLKWKLIEKDQEVEMARRRAGSQRGMLKKSQSLDSGQTLDLKRQLDVVTQEAQVLKEKVASLQSENDELQAANSKLELTGGSRKASSEDAEKATKHAATLEEKIKSLETENAQLKAKIHTLDAKANALSKQITSDVDVGKYKKQISELEETNKRLQNDLKRYESTDEGKKSKADKEELNLETASNPQLRERIKDLEGEVCSLKEKVSNRESENKRLETEVTSYRDDMDKMLDTFKEREANLQLELQTWEQKNAVLSNLLDMVTQRTESLRSEKPSERTASVVSTVSDVTLGSDDVFSQREETLQNWDDKFLCRIESLENLLKEERQRVQTAEKRLMMKDGQQSALTDDMKLHQREKEILLQEKTIKEVLEGEKEVFQVELSLCQKQLSESQEHGRSLRNRLEKMQKVHDTTRQDFQKKSTELEEARKASETWKKKLEEKEKELEKALSKEEEKKVAGKDSRPGGGGVKEKEPASWRWEKQELDRTIKELRKKIDDLHRQLSRQQVRVKLASDDRGRLGRQDSLEEKGDSTKTKQLEKDIQTLKEEAGTFKKQISQLEARIKEEQSTLKKQEKQWDAERELLESDRKEVLREASEKEEIIKSKDGIIKQKDSLLQQKSKALKDREESVLGHDTILKQKEDALNKAEKQLAEVNAEAQKLKVELKQKEDLHNVIEVKLKELNENLRVRDERIREKDDIIENMNRSLSEKESAVTDMDNSIRQAMKKLDDKEAELKTFLSKTDEMKGELNTLKSRSDNLERKLHDTEREHGKEIASLVILREKMEAHISQLKTEKKTSEEEVQDFKRVLMEKEDFWRSCRNDLEAELRNSKEKLHSLEASHMGKEGETIIKLSGERDDLVNEKNILVKEVKRLAREMENAEFEWQKEKKTFRNLLGEKDEALKEKVSKCSRLSEEVQELNSKDSRAASRHRWLSREALQVTDGSSSDGEVARATRESSLPSSVISAMDRSELIHKAEKVSLEELYENKLRIVRDQLAQAHDDVHTMQRENAELRDVLGTSQRTLSDLKRQHDVDGTTWQEEKSSLERTCKEHEDRRKQLDALQRVVSELESQVRNEERQRTEMEVKLKKERTNWDAEKLILRSQLNRLEEQASLTASGKFKWSERQKRESAWDQERSDNKKALTEYETLARDLEAKVTHAERSREKGLRELKQQLESSQRSWDRERADLTKRCNQMEDRSRQVSGLQQTLIDLQYKFQSERESAVRERTGLQAQLAAAEKAKLEEKLKFAELLAEVKKVKELTPLLAKNEGVELDIKKKTPSEDTSGQTSRILQLTPSGELSTTRGAEVVRTIPIRRIVDEPYDKPLVEPIPVPASTSGRSETKLTFRAGSSTYITISRRSEQD